MKKYFIAASACALMASASVQAADMINPHAGAAHPATPMHYNWEGFYAGGAIVGSWGLVRESTRDNTSLPVEKPGNRKSYRPDGFIGGLYAGYNFRAGDILILGVDTDMNWSNAHARFFAGANLFNGTSETGFRHQWIGATRARIGLVSDRFLPYFAAGVAYSQFDTTYKYKVQVRHADNEEKTFSRKRMGWTAGFGLDYAMTDNILLRAEYRYTDLGKETFAVTKPWSAMHRLRYAMNEVRLGVAYKF